MKRVKHLIKKNLHANYYFYRSMLTIFNLKKKNYLNSIYFRTKILKVPFYPEYSIYKNVFNKKNKALDIIKKNNLNHFFLNNDYNSNNFGLSYYFIFDSNNLKKLNIQLNEDDNKGLIQFKTFVDNMSEKSHFFEVNCFFNFNINFLCSLEIYKIIILLYLHKLN